MKRILRRLALLHLGPRLFCIGVGIPLAALGLQGFLLPNGFIDGGMMGVSLLIAQVFGVPIWALILLTNAPFIALGFRQISKTFGVVTLTAIGGLAIMLSQFQLPVVTHDTLLAAVFGGVFLGAGVGLVIRGGGALDGTEILALYINRKAGFTIGDIILAINILIFSIAALTLNVEIALYSMLTYFSASKMVDFVIQGIEEYIGVTVISLHKNQEIKAMIISKLGRGVTLYKGGSGYGSKGHTQDFDIVFTVMTRLEIGKLKAEIELIDRRAFIVEHPIREIRGGVVKRRAHLMH